MLEIKRGKIIGGSFAILPRHIVVAVNERNLPQDATGFDEMAIRFIRGGRCGAVHGNKSDGCGSDVFDAHAGTVSARIILRTHKL